jgi:long-subunit fatty acid transport protein
MTSESVRPNAGSATHPVAVIGANAYAPARRRRALRFWQCYAVSLGIPGALLLASADARAAGNDQPYPVGELASTMGGAAVAVTHDGTATWYNPAGLGRVTEEGISATLNVYGVQIERTKAFADGLDLAGTKTAIFPGSVGYVKPLGVLGNDIRHAVGLALVVPDFARHEVALDDTQFAGYEWHVRERLLEQTLWIVPGWGACFGTRLCAGASLQVGYWSATGLYSTFEQWSADAASGTPAGANSFIEQDDLSAVEAGMSVGVQYRASDSTWIGLSVRSPVMTIWGSGSILVMDADQGTGQIRRANDNSIKIDERLPLNIRLGMGLDLQDWLLAADVSLSLPQSTYQSVRAHDGTTDPANGSIPALKALDANGQQVGGLIDIGVPQGRLTVVNVSLGAQYRLSPKTAIQAGFFTDFSGQPDALIDELHPHINRYGITAGVSLKGASSTTTIGLIATIGTGRSYSVDVDAQGNNLKADAQSEAIYFTLGGSTRLGEAPEKQRASTTEPSESAPHLPEAAPNRQRDSQASPSPPPEQDQSATSPHAKKKAKKTRKKDSE